MHQPDEIFYVSQMDGILKECDDWMKLGVQPMNEVQADTVA